MGYAEHIFLLLVIVFPVMGTLVLPSSSFAQNGGISPLGNIDVGKLTFYPSALGLTILCLNRYQHVAATALKALPILAFSAWSLLSCLWAADAIIALNTTGRMLIIILCAVYIQSNLSFLSIIELLTRSFLISMSISLACILFFPQIGYNNTLLGYESAWRGAMAQKNLLGSLMNYAVIVGYYSILFHRNLIATRYLVTVVSMAMLMMSQSATALAASISTFLFIILMAFINNAKDIYEKTSAITLMLFSIISIFATILFSNDLFAAIGRSETLTGRSDIWPIVWDLIQDKLLLGHGHAFWTIDTQTRAGISARGGWLIAHAHNAYLDIWLQTGLVGLALALFFIAKGIARALYLAIRGMPSVGFLWISIFFVTFARSFTETQWVDPNANTMFWTTLSYIGLHKTYPKTPEVDHRSTAATS